MKKILFVCSGNTCRSPMAEGYFNHLTGRSGMRGEWEAVSAGLHAFEGSPVNERSRIVCFEDEIDLSKHLSRSVKTERIEEAFLILTMTREHKEELLERFPGSSGKTYTLKEFAGQKGDIPDPIGLSEQVYESAYGEIKKLVAFVFEKVRQEGKPGRTAK